MTLLSKNDDNAKAARVDSKEPNIKSNKKVVINGPPKMDFNSVNSGLVHKKI